MLTSCSTLFGVIPSCAHRDTFYLKNVVSKRYVGADAYGWRVNVHTHTQIPRDVSKWRLRQSLIFTWLQGIRTSNFLYLPLSPLLLQHAVASNLARSVPFMSPITGRKWKNANLILVPEIKYEKYAPPSATSSTCHRNSCGNDTQLKVK